VAFIHSLYLFIYILFYLETFPHGWWPSVNSVNKTCAISVLFSAPKINEGQNSILVTFYAVFPIAIITTQRDIADPKRSYSTEVAVYC